ncbi:capsule biosynthesis protein [Aristophania vespae]|uniref:capsule biosynthesis protein n=1 Tax=Aristophania vespae TaxID=2697033 RepID=UPI0038D22EA3
MTSNVTGHKISMTEPENESLTDSSREALFEDPRLQADSIDFKEDPPAEHRRFLLLQGLMGPFFQSLGKALRKRKHKVWKINFNGGDELFWRLPGGIAFRGQYGTWPGFLGHTLQKHKITDVILFGDCRELHSQAILICRDMGVTVHVFEEGYIRPDWVTLERGGVNGYSTLPKDPEWYRNQAARLPLAPPHNPVPSSFRRRALEGIAYNSATILLKWRFPHWTDYRPWPPLVEGVGWLRRLMRRKKAERRSAALMRWLAPSTARKSAKPYMLLPLQLDADAQLRLHSSFSGMAEVIVKVITSFANHAPLEQRLVIKEHPLDNGVQNWKKIIDRLAKAHGVSNRIDYMEAGDIAQVVKYAQGVITVNSTTGTLALACGVPVITLGQAVYDIADITNQGKLNDFWKNPGKPDELTFAAYRRVLIEQCLIPGGFFSEEGVEKLTRSAIARIEKTPFKPYLEKN